MINVETLISCICFRPDDTIKLLQCFTQQQFW